MTVHDIMDRDAIAEMYGDDPPEREEGPPRRFYCPECYGIGEHVEGCPAAPDDDDDAEDA